MYAKSIARYQHTWRYLGCFGSFWRISILSDSWLALAEPDIDDACNSTWLSSCTQGTNKRHHDTKTGKIEIYSQVNRQMAEKQILSN